MSLNLTSRLAKLEAQQAPPVALENCFTPGIRLLSLLLAVHLGGLQDHEAIAEGTARALGYGRVAEMRAAMQAEGTAVFDWGSRHGAAVEQMLATRRSGPATGETNEAAIRSLVSGLPEGFRSYFIDTDSEKAIDLAAEWVSL